MDLQLMGKRALATGSNSGIGEGIAKVLAGEGTAVIIHGRNAEHCKQVVNDIVQAGGNATAALGDLTTQDGCNAVCAVAEQLGGVDILVNNAGGRASSHRTDGKDGPMNPAWLETPWSDWLWTFEQNVGAAVRLIQKLVPGMKERGFGRMINIASAAATQAEPNLAEYQAIKAAMVNMSASLAKTLAATGIIVNTVTPGIVMTPEDIGYMVALLSSPLGSYMTGANYRVDGGQIRSIN